MPQEFGEVVLSSNTSLRCRPTRFLRSSPPHHDDLDPNDDDHGLFHRTLSPRAARIPTLCVADVLYAHGVHAHSPSRHDVRVLSKHVTSATIAESTTTAIGRDPTGRHSCDDDAVGEAALCGRSVPANSRSTPTSPKGRAAAACDSSHQSGYIHGVYRCRSLILLCREINKSMHRHQQRSTA